MKNAKSDVDERISVRVPRGSHLKERIAAVVERTGVAESVLVVRATEAIVAYIERHGAITFPIEVRELEPPRARGGRS